MVSLSLFYFRVNVLYSVGYDTGGLYEECNVCYTMGLCFKRSASVLLDDAGPMKITAGVLILNTVVQYNYL